MRVVMYVADDTLVSLRDHPSIGVAKDASVRIDALRCTGRRALVARRITVR